MKPFATARSFLGGLILLGLVGCETTATRIEARKVVFAQQSPTVQQAIERGEPGLGFTPELTYMAMGKPNRVEASADGRETVWTYMNYNTASGGFAEVHQNAVGMDNFGRKDMVQHSGEVHRPGKNEIATRPDNINQDGDAETIRTKDTDGGKGWREVSGASDLLNGNVRVADKGARPKTAVEMINDTERQDLLVTFYDGKIVNFELVRN